MEMAGADFRPHLEKATAGEPLSEAEARAAFLCIMRGAVSEIELAAFLVALKVRGETADEISGAVSAMTGLMIPAVAPDGAVDVVGTGGDAKGTFNVSTATAFVLAGGGVPVAKHGNRAVSSKSGAADVLEKLGVNIKLPPDRLDLCFTHAGIAFLWAPQHHPAMRFAGPVRQALKLRTIFNLLGPLSNPASVKRTLLGTYAEEWLLPMAETMRRRGAGHVWVVNGDDGMDELTTTGKSRVIELKDGVVSRFEIHPSDVGLPVARVEDLSGGEPEQCAAAMRSLFKGKPGPLRDIVLLNAAAGFIIAGRTDNLRDGVERAGEAIDSGKAEAALDALIEVSNRDRGGAESIAGGKAAAE